MFSRLPGIRFRSGVFFIQKSRHALGVLLRLQPLGLLSLEIGQALVERRNLIRRHQRAQPLGLFVFPHDAGDGDGVREEITVIPGSAVGKIRTTIRMKHPLL